MSSGTRSLGRWRPLLWGVPGLLAAVYLIALLVNFGTVTAGINTFADGIIAPVLGKLARQAPPGSQILLGHHAYYEEFLFLRATAGLSYSRQLWEFAPLLWTLAGFGLVGWSAWQALGRFPALLTVSALICLADLGRFSFFTFDWHGLTVVHTILIGSALVWLAPRAHRLGWSRLAAIGVGLGLLSALPQASDPLFPVWALGPMCLTAALMSWRSRGPKRWAPLAVALITVLVAVPAGAAIAHGMRSSGIGPSPFHYPFLASPGGMLKNLAALLEGDMALGGGYHAQIAPTFVGVIVLVAAAFMLAALGSALLEGSRVLRREAVSEPTAPATLPYVAFWLSSLILQSLAMVASGATQHTAGGSRYVLAGYVAIMALLPLVALRGPRWRLAVTVAVCLFAFCSTFQLIRKPYVVYSTYPLRPAAQRLEAFARAHHVHYGYAGYWDAPDLTWLTAFRLQLYPIRADCGPLNICPFPTAQINTWYDPRPGTRSMMIADQAEPYVSHLDRRLGPPLASTRIGTLIVAVYPYDVALAMVPHMTERRLKREVAAASASATPTRSCRAACS